MASIKWLSPVSGTWSVAANWAGGVLPGAGDDVSIGGIGASSAYTISVTGSAGFAAHGITLADSFATLAFVSAAPTVSAPITMSAGTIFGYSTTVTDLSQLTATGGSVYSSTVATLTVNGTLSLSNVSITSSLALAGSGGTGTATLINNGIIFLAPGMLLDNAIASGNGGTIYWSSAGAIGSHATVKGGLHAYSIDANTLSNAGTLVSDGLNYELDVQMTSGVNTGIISATNFGHVYIDDSISNSGTVLSSAAGTLFLGELTSNTGLVSCTGTGSRLFLSVASADTVGVLHVSAGGLLGISSAGTNAAVTTNGSTLTLGNGGSVSNSGGTVVLSGTITNTGTISGASPFLFYNAEIDGGSVYDAAGTSTEGTLRNVDFHGTLAAGVRSGPYGNDRFSFLLAGTTTLAGIAAGSGATVTASGNQSVTFSDSAAASAGSSFALSGSGGGLWLNGTWNGAGSILSVTGTNFSLRIGASGFAMQTDVSSGATLYTYVSTAPTAALLSGGVKLTVEGYATDFSGSYMLGGTVSVSGAGAFFSDNYYTSSGKITLSAAAQIAATSGGVVNLFNHTYAGSGTLSAGGAGSEIIGNVSGYAA